MPFRVYLAGPISGLSWSGSTEWRDYVSNKLSPQGIECLSPLRFKNFLEGELRIEGSYEEHPLATARGIYTRDKGDVSRADAILVFLTGAERVSIGTVMEIAWADMLNKPIILVSEDSNIHNHPMINESIGYTLSTLDEAIDVIRALFNVL